jgi:enediyne biosynthesis protein E4
VRRALAALAGVVLLGAAAPDPRPWGVSLVDVGAQAGLRFPSVYGGEASRRFILEANGAGVAWIDYDEDGRVDAFVLAGTRLAPGGRQDVEWKAGEAPTNRLYRNLGRGAFEDVTDRAGLRRGGWASSVCAGDYDNDGHLDLFLTYFGQNVLYRNRGGRFEDVTAAAGLAEGRRQWGAGCTFVDYDRDGRLDLFVARYLDFDREHAPEPGCMWKGFPVMCGPRGLPTDVSQLFHNDGERGFRDVSAASGVAKVAGRYAMSALAADLDGDGWTDIYVACDTTPSIFFRNNRDGTFTDAALEAGLALSESGRTQAGMGLALADVDRDGLVDVLKTHFADDIPALYRNLGGGRFTDVATAAGLSVQNRHVEWGAGLPDLDNDGWPDAVYVTGNVYKEAGDHLREYPDPGPRVVFRNRGGLRFEDVTAQSGPATAALHSSRGAAFADYDDDGDLDVLVMNMNAPPSLLRNDCTGCGHWLKVKLVGTRSNRAGLGATVVVRAGGLAQVQVALSQSSFYSHDDRRLHFGLGALTEAEVEVRWPSGTVDKHTHVPAGRLTTIREGHPAQRR